MARPDPPSHPQPRRPGRPRSATAEQAILDAVVSLLAEHGVAGVSVEAVAARAGVAKTTIYRRWTDKSELVLDALARLRGPVVQPPPGLSVRDDLVYLLTRVAAGQTDALWARVLPRLIGAADEHAELTEQYLTRVIGPRRERFVEVLRRGVTEGVIRPDVDLAVAAETLVAPVLLSSWVRFGPRVRPGQIPHLVDLVLAGIAMSQ